LRGGVLVGQREKEAEFLSGFGKREEWPTGFRETIKTKKMGAAAPL